MKRTKYLWLKSRENLTEKEEAKWRGLRSSRLETLKVWALKVWALKVWALKVWALKEAFRSFFTCATPQAGAAFFHRWHRTVKRLGNAALCEVAQRFLTHLPGLLVPGLLVPGLLVPGLLAYLRQHVTNAEAEGMNSQIQRIKANARGFRDSSCFRIALLFFLGRLNLYPHSSR